MLKLNENIKYYNFTIEGTEDMFHYEIMETHDEYELWIYNSEYGIKQHVYGFLKSQSPFYDILEYMTETASEDMCLYWDFIRENGLE